MDYTTIFPPYDKTLHRQDQVVGSIDTPSEALTTFPGQADNRIMSDRNFDDLWINKSIKSRGYKPQASGFWLDGRTGNAQFNNLVLVGGIIRFQKTSFTDSVHAGYFISGDGIYFGSAGDATYLKFDVTAETLTLVGTFQTDTGDPKIALYHDTNVLAVYNSLGDQTVQIGGAGAPSIFVQQYVGDNAVALGLSGASDVYPTLYITNDAGSANIPLYISNLSSGIAAIFINDSNTSGPVLRLIQDSAGSFGRMLNFYSYVTLWGGDTSPDGSLTANGTGDVVFSADGRIYVAQGGTSWETVAFLSDIPP